MWLLLACAPADDTPTKDAVADTGEDSAEDSGDSGADSGDSGADSGDTGGNSGDSGADSGDTGGDSGAARACATTCDCDAGELCYDGACGEAGPDLASWRGQLDRVVAAMDPTTGAFATESAYPTEALLSLASGAALLCDEGYAEAARTRAAYARTWEDERHFLHWSGFPWVTRDYQARHVYNLHAAGRALEDAELLAAADAAAAALLSLDRVAYREFTLYCTTYDPDPPYACVGGTWIDVNQNAEVGMALAALSADPDSVWYGDPLALDVVDQELSAAISVQRWDGAIPIGSEGEWTEAWDTLYGSYAAFSWAVAAPLVGDPVLDAHVDLAAAWLAPMSGAAPTTDRWYPTRTSGGISMAEGTMRLPVLHHTGLLDPAFRDAWWALVATSGETGTTFLPLWLVHDAGVPLAEIVPPR